MVRFIAWTVRRLLPCGLALALAAGTSSLWADGAKLMTGNGPADPNATTIEMFEGIAKGDIAVKLIPKDSKEARVLIENKTDKPLSVKLPDAFAGVPVLGQVAAAGAGVGGAGVGAGGGNQGMGGGMGGMGMGGGGMGMGGMGGGMFNVPPEKIGQFKVATVCLEHGKAEPKASVPYEIKPIASFTDKPEVQELCRMLGTGQLNQRAAQAAAWNLNSGMSWQQLATKQLRFANGTSQPYFSPQEIQAAMKVAFVATQRAEQRKQQQGSANSAEAAPRN